MPNNASDWWNQNKPQGYTGSPDLPIQEDAIITDLSPKARYGLGFTALPNAGLALRDTAKGLQAVSPEDVDSAILDLPRYKGFQDYYNNPENDFTNRYNTQLTPEEEVRFQQWMKDNKRSPTELFDYDLRGAWRELMSGEMSPDDRGHLGDKYKKPNHPTFSDQSIYHGKDGFIGGTWSNWGKKRGWVFKPSSTNKMDNRQLSEYFAKEERGNHLYDTREADRPNGFVRAMTWLADKLNPIFENSRTFPKVTNPPQAGGWRG